MKLRSNWRMFCCGLQKREQVFESLNVVGFLGDVLVASWSSPVQSVTMPPAVMVRAIAWTAAHAHGHAMYASYSSCMRVLRSVWVAAPMPTWFSSIPPGGTL